MERRWLLQITEGDPGSSNTMCPVHFQLLVPVTYRGLSVLCVRTHTKSVVVQGSTNHTRSSSAKASSRALYHKWFIRLLTHERLHCRVTLSRDEGFNQFQEMFFSSVAESINIKQNQKWFCMSISGYLVYDTCRFFLDNVRLFEMCLSNQWIEWTAIV